MAKRKLFDYSRVPRRQRTHILAAMLFWSVLMYVGISRLVLYAVEVSGESMVPTLHDGERCVAHRWMLHVRPLKRGDIVAVQIPWFDSPVIKRIVALPVETVRVESGKVWVNDESLAEYYLPAGALTDGGGMDGKTFEVLPDCYFVLGDNRGASVDSRDFGAVRREWVLGVIY